MDSDSDPLVDLARASRLELSVADPEQSLLKRLARGAVGDRIYMSLTADHRLLTVLRPASQVALWARGAIRRGNRSAGVERLDATLVINLAKRRDRLAGFTAEMQRLRVENYIRLEAFSHENGLIGCLMSHAECLRMMLAGSWQCMMVCEDDARFHVRRRQLDTFVDAFLDDPTAEVACLAYHHCGPPRAYNLLFARAPDVTHNTGCYLIKRSIAADLLALFEESIAQLAVGGDRHVYAADRIWTRLISTRVFLLPIRRVAFQEDGYSDVQGAHRLVSAL